MNYLFLIENISDIIKNSIHCNFMNETFKIFICIVFFSSLFCSKRIFLKRNEYFFLLLLTKIRVHFLLFRNIISSSEQFRDLLMKRK
jgi:hypothetical protein